MQSVQACHGCRTLSDVSDTSDVSEPGASDEQPSLRDRKRARTRQALVDAAIDLFDRDGYERTTIADIAAAAEVGTRTFFNYFASKEELLFPESDARVRATIEAIAARGPDEGPTDVLLRALRTVGAAGSVGDDMAGGLAELRLRLIRTVPAVRGRALYIQLEAQREIARHLPRRSPTRSTRSPPPPSPAPSSGRSPPPCRSCSNAPTGPTTRPSSTACCAKPRTSRWPPGRPEPCEARSSRAYCATNNQDTLMA
jgi:AcrR family transcriptional regulator